jgi:pyruvate/2-oxoglutarate dehydrogenase complex dihydrolipoamide acyltransferase (E2) component
VRIEVTLPDLGEDSVQAVTVAGWLARPGQVLGEGEDLLELTTDKAAFTLPCPRPGMLSSTIVAEGDKINVGDALCILETTD